MESLYPYFLIIHILCAIIFLGYIFTDVVLLSLIRKKLGEEIADKIFSIIGSRARKIMPLCLALLILSGGVMISRYINSEVGFFDTTLQQFLFIKMILAFVILVAVVISLSCYYFGLKNPLAKIIHILTLILGLFIVLLAKMAFYF